MPNTGTLRADAGLDQRQRQGVAVTVVGFVPGMRFEPEAGGMDVGARAGQQDAVDHVEQRADVGDVRLAGKHQRHRVGDFGYGAEISLTNHLRREAILDEVHIPDHPDHWLAHRDIMHGG